MTCEIIQSMTRPEIICFIGVEILGIWKLFQLMNRFGNWAEKKTLAWIDRKEGPR